MRRNKNILPSRFAEKNFADQKSPTQPHVRIAPPSSPSSFHLFILPTAPHYLNAWNRLHRSRFYFKWAYATQRERNVRTLLRFSRTSVLPSCCVNSLIISQNMQSSWFCHCVCCSLYSHPFLPCLFYIQGYEEKCDEGDKRAFGPSPRQGCLNHLLRVKWMNTLISVGYIITDQLYSPLWPHETTKI